MQPKSLTKMTTPQQADSPPTSHRTTAARPKQVTLDVRNQYDALIGDGRAGVEAPSCERGVHVRTCRCTPHLTCVSLLSNGSLAAHQVQTQSAQQFARYGKRVCTCARADATHPDLCKVRIYWAPSHTQNLNAILPAVFEIWKRGVHVRTCRCTPPQTCTP